MLIAQLPIQLQGVVNIFGAGFYLAAALIPYDKSQIPLR